MRNIGILWYVDCSHSSSLHLKAFTSQIFKAASHYEGASGYRGTGLRWNGVRLFAVAANCCVDTLWMDISTFLSLVLCRYGKALRCVVLGELPIQCQLHG